MEFEYKQVLVVRKDLNLSRGKLAVQVAHAALGASEIADPKVKESWEREGAKKVVLEVENKEKLIKLYEKAKNMGLPAVLIKDAGLTEIPPGTTTVLGIGPEKSEVIDKLTSSLPLLS